NEKYGMVESDFISAEFEMVPALKSKYVGFDKSLIAAYAHDDRVCSYTALTALLDVTEPEKTCLCILADKEEVGSGGLSGVRSYAYDMFFEDLCAMDGTRLSDCYANSFCLSSDVTSAHDPLYPDVDEMQNAARINYGVGVCKYTGARGKGGASDASAETMGRLRSAFAREGVLWQSVELGKVDKGGGGTVAIFFSNRGIPTVDAGVPVLSMHAPYEVVSKIDAYMTFKAARAVYKEI
ncbi:MAG: aminopeptidase, partial [Oscillospiraceae bacterium]|nr:aminopeptidase [Oscillospiraceae bacterium]